MHRPHSFRPFAAALALAALVAVAGCGATTPAPQRLVVVGAPTAEQAQPRLSTDDLAVVRAAAESNAGVLDVVVAGDPAAGSRIDLTPYRRAGDDRQQVEHGPARGGMLDDNVRRTAGVVSTLAPVAGEPDLLAALHDAARTEPAGTMIVADSGITTTDPLDLRVLGWDQDPAVVVDDLGRRGFLPDLRGWSVRFSGLGRVAGAQPPLPAPQQRWLEDLWLQLCRAGGAAACAVTPGDTGTSGGAAPRSPRHAPVVPVPDVDTQRAVDGAVVTTLPASRLGFTEGSAALSPDAGGLLAEATATARDGRHVVEVVGYVAFWGSDAYRSDLSTRRARAVADLLVASGVPAARVSARGLGAGDGPDASQTDGVFDEAKVRANGLRRVVVTVRPVAQP